MLHIINGFVLWIETLQTASVLSGFEVILLRLSGASSVYEAYSFIISGDKKPESRITETVESYLENVQTSFAHSENISITETEGAGLSIKLWQQASAANSRKMQLASFPGLQQVSAPHEFFMKVFSYIQASMVRSASEEALLRNQIREKNQDLVECAKDIASLTSARSNVLSESLQGLALIFNEKNRLISSLKHAAEDPLKRKHTSSSGAISSNAAPREAMAQSSSLVSNILSASMKKTQPKKEAGSLPEKKRRVSDLPSKTSKNVQDDPFSRRDEIDTKSSSPPEQNRRIVELHSQSSNDVQSSASASLFNSQVPLTQPASVPVPEKKYKRSMYDMSDDED